MEGGKIFVRERNKVGEKEKKPRFAVVATSGIDLKIKAQHVRKQEIEEIARQLNAEIIYLEISKDDDDEDDD
ncbi:MAG TPA: hypothetical protein DEA44_07835 [Firmicutes bacterium]|nr:hypothetical protein [Bacillota bacterium]